MRNKKNNKGFIQHYFFLKKKNSAGFTLIELLIVIAIIAIIAAVVFVALDPLTRFRDARDSRRWSDASALMSAIKVDQVDNGGSYLTAITSVTDDVVYMIGTAVAGCDDAYDAGNCDSVVVNDTACVDLSGLVTGGYIGSVPVSPNGSATWTSSTTGYTLTKASTGILTIQACESENSDSISVSR
ncbi:prepilin-type N-terminal cleavage/methylation domain-containing protein [Patescibacteria group bacterium]|nr:prepilin-type N-terminal cleavage/methylation domain-containing protein [Patescibacteria group bacterium]